MSLSITTGTPPIPSGTLPADVATNYKAILGHPLDGVKGDLMERSFEFLPLDKRASVRNENELAVIGRRIATFLSNLVDEENKQAFSTYGTFLNFLGHALNDAFIKHLDKQGYNLTERNIAEVAAYSSAVKQCAEVVFKKVEENPTTKISAHNFSYTLNVLDVPEDKWAKGVPLNVEGKEKLAECFAEFFNTSFKTTLITRDDITPLSASSLRAVVNKTDYAAFIKFIKEMVQASGFLDNIDTLPWVNQAVCMIIEGKEISDWVLKKAPHEQMTTEEIKQILGKTEKTSLSSKDLENEAVKKMFSGVMDRMREYAAKNPVFPLSLEENEELIAYLCQDFYRYMLGVKSVVKGDAINKTRQFICPEIGDIQYPRVTWLSLPTKPFDPLRTKTNKLFEYLNEVQEHLQSPILEVAIAQLTRESKLNQETKRIQAAMQNL